MADKQEEQGKWFEVKNEKGEVVKSLYAPKGGALYDELSSGSGQAYKTNGTDAEEYLPAAEAKASVSIDPYEGTVTVSGPSWLVGDVMNSDSFKKNYTENKALLNAVNAYRTNPDSTIADPKTGEAIKISDVLKSYQDGANSYAGAFAQIKEYKLDAQSKYGVNFSDENVYTANNYHRKDDYDTNGVIYIPDWAADKYDWASLGSYDAEHRSVSADDFYKNVYLEDFDNHTSSELQEAARNKMTEFTEYNVYDKEDEAAAKEHAAKADDEAYADELARTIQMYNIVSQNKPEVSAAYNVVLFTSSSIKSFGEATGKAGQSITSGIMQAFEGVADFVPGEVDDFALTKLNPVYWGMFFLGEGITSVRATGGDIQDYSKNLQEAVNAFMEGRSGEHIDLRRQEMDAAFAEFSSELNQVSDAWGAGEAFGNLAYKIAENVVALNLVGGAIAKGTVKLAGGIYQGSKVVGFTAGSVGSVMSKVMSPSSVAAVFKTLGFSGNVLAQGVLETFIDDKDLLNKAIASGEMTDELWDKIKYNVMWNAIGEASGFGASKGIAWTLTNTTPGKLINTGMTKMSASIAGKKFRALYNIMKWLNKGDVDTAVSELGKATDTAVNLGKYNTSQYLALAEASELIAKMPVTKELDEASIKLLNDAYDLVYGKRGLEAMEIGQETVDQTTKAVEDASEAVSKSDITPSKSLSDRINANFENQRKAVLLRMNLENQIDAINKGVSIKMSEINTYAGKSFTEYADAQNKVMTMERRRSGLTFREKGSLLTKESSELLGYNTQITRYSAKIAKVDAIKATEGMDLKKAVKAAGFKNVSDYNGSVKYLADMQAKVGELSAKLGPELTDALGDLQIKLARYSKAVDDYMMARGYYTKEMTEKILKWRASGDWGEDGELFIHTARLFNAEDIDSGVKRFVTDLENPSMFATKMVADDAEFLKPGDIEDSFLDPNMVMYGRLRASAAVARGQDMGRALHAISLPSRKLAGFNLDGTSAYEAQIITKDLGKMKSEFMKAFNSTKGKPLADAIKESFSVEGLVDEGLNKYRSYKKVTEGKEAKTLARQERDVSRAIKDKLTSSKSVQNDLIDNGTVDDMAQMIGAAPEGVDVPSFDFRNMKSAEFNEWYAQYGVTEAGKDSAVGKCIKDKLGDQQVNITNVKKVLRADPDFTAGVQKSWVKSGDGAAFRKTDAYKQYVDAQYEATLSAKDKTWLASHRKKLEDIVNRRLKLQAEAENLTIDPKDYKTFGKEFVSQIEGMSNDVITEMRTRLAGKNRTFDDLVQRLVDAGVDKELAEKYVILHQLSKLKADDFAAPLKATSGKKAAPSAIQREAKKAMGKDVAKKYGEEVADVIAGGVKDNIDSMFRTSQGLVAKCNGAQEVMDMERYWSDIEKQMADIRKMGITTDKGGKLKLDDIRGTRNVVQLVDQSGTLRFYETSPLYAELTNFKPNYYFENTNRISDTILSVNSTASTIFRWGTTGFDLTSYINQWFRDPFNAVFVAGARPFTDLGTGGVKSTMASIASDSIPFGQRLFGKYVTTEISSDIVESSFAASEAGLKEMFGEEWLKGLQKGATEGLSGEAAEQAYKRAVVEYAAGKAGYEALPGLGGVTEAQFYRGDAGEATTLKEVRKEEYELALERGMTEAQKKEFARQSSKMRTALDNFFEDTSRGNWRESFLRKSVYTTQYKNAIESGMTMQEAQTWATRYALDATTDFGRSFAFGNRFIKSVPYLGAAINGQKSFIRLLELDPAGVTARLSFGMILPYMSMLSESLSDPKNREIYKTIKEYEKQDSAFFVINGSKVQIPIPQELSGFLAPFRHIVEKASDAQDASWRDLITSDALGIWPIDLSGFSNLDANDILNDDEETGLGARIGRGLEKAISGLMPPTVKSAYMWKFGRDPYTGRKIDTSYVVLNEDGEPEIMDSTKSQIAQEMHQLFPNLSASAALKILQTAFGRSTISVLDGLKGTLAEGVNMGSYAESLAERLTAPVDGGSDYNEAKSNWNNAINQAYAKRQEMLNDPGFQKALSAIRNTKTTPEKLEGAKQTYREYMDEFSKYVLDIANNMKTKYPDQYTKTRVAQVVSLLTLPTGYTYNDTAYSSQLQTDSYYDARASALDTFLRMGFPDAEVGTNMLGTAYYDKNTGEYQFKEFTPYQIEMLNSEVFGSSDQFTAMIQSALKAAEISPSDKWTAYYSAKDKAERKEISAEWNKNIVKQLYPLFSRYGADSILGSSATRDVLEDYLLISNPFKAKQYMYEIFGGTQ